MVNLEKKDVIITLSKGREIATIHTKWGLAPADVKTLRGSEISNSRWVY